MSIWKLAVLKRWFGDQQPSEGDDAQDWDDDAEDGDEGEEGDGEGSDAEGEEGEGEEGEGEGGDGEGDAEGEGEEGDADGEGEGEGDPDGEGKGESDGRGLGGGKPLNPDDYKNLNSLTDDQVRNPEPTVKNEVGESSTPDDAEAGKPPIVICDPVVFPILPVSPYEGNVSTQAWQGFLRTSKVSALRLALRRLMQRSDSSGREGGLRQGRLSQRGITRLLSGADNVFERRFQEEGESVAVTLLIDRSDSMRGRGKMQQAADVSLLLAETASNAGARCEVIAFDSARDEQNDVEQGLFEDVTGRKSYSHREVLLKRVDGAWMWGAPSAVYVCKSFAQSIGHLRRLYTTMRNMADYGTADASALKWAGARLLKEGANRRILFVICDGMGDTDETFRHVVTGLEKQGVIVIGIGIGCTPTMFCRRFTHAVAIENVADLCGKAFGLLIGTIAKARGL